MSRVLLSCPVPMWHHYHRIGFKSKRSPELRRNQWQNGGIMSPKSYRSVWGGAADPGTVKGLLSATWPNWFTFDLLDETFITLPAAILFFYITEKDRNCSVIINRRDVGGRRGNKISEDGSEFTRHIYHRWRWRSRTTRSQRTLGLSRTPGPKYSGGKTREGGRLFGIFGDGLIYSQWP